MRTCARVAIVLSVAALATPCVFGQIYPLQPDWLSADTQVSTGGAFADINRDGWLDFVVANGNDISRQRLVVYFNDGTGKLQTSPGYQSADIAYNGHLDIADVNGDGWLDVAVAHLGEFNTTAPIAKLYLNNNGTLSANPDWSANIIGNAFGCAFGDMNNDGRPDLAVATGWAYSPQKFYKNFVYANTGGQLSATPTWTSDDQNHYQGAHWVDCDGDGWLDLAFACAGAKSAIYKNLGGLLETTASWTVGDLTTQDAIMVTSGDVTGDGVPDVIWADNNQIQGGSGRFRMYEGQPGAFPKTTAAWTYNEGYCSAVALADISIDGKLDLATGAWWDNTRLFYNTGTGLPNTANWSSGRTSVIEKICFGDVDKNGLRPLSYAVAPVQGQRLFFLPHRPIQKVTVVEVDGVPLTPSQYHVNYECGWVSIGVAANNELEVDYTASTKLDMGITNWDSSVPNFLYFNRFLKMGDANCDGSTNFGDITPFVQLLDGSYKQFFPECDGPISCDFDKNGKVDFGDINPFVQALGGWE